MHSVSDSNEGSRRFHNHGEGPYLRLKAQKHSVWGPGSCRRVTGHGDHQERAITHLAMGPAKQTGSKRS